MSPQLTELYGEFLPYQAARQVASFVPSNDLESLDVTRGKVAIDVLAFVNTSSEVTHLGGQVTAVRYLPVAFGMPGIEVQAVFPISELPALGALANVVNVTPLDRVGPQGSTAPGITTNPGDQTVVAGTPVMFTAAASGTPAPTVQWQVSHDGGTIFSNIAGATSTTLACTTDVTATGYQYRAVFTNVLGEVSTTAATLTVHAPTSIVLAGTISGTYVTPMLVPDIGEEYDLTGSGDLGSAGAFQASGALSTPGFVLISTAGGTLTLTSPAGTVTLALQSQPVTGFSALPQQFNFAVHQATGAYAGLTEHGTISIALTATTPGSYTTVGTGTFTLTMQPDPNTGVAGLVLLGTQPATDVSVTARAQPNGPALAGALTDEHGRFTLYLAPGKYVIQVSGFLMGTVSQTVVVPKHGFAQVVRTLPPMPTEVVPMRNDIFNSDPSVTQWRP